MRFVEILNKIASFKTMLSSEDNEKDEILPLNWSNQILELELESIQYNFALLKDPATLGRHHVYAIKWN